jgi:uncharacterized protein with HEPN domain
MAKRPVALHLADIVEAVERERRVLGDTPLAAFEGDWQKQWLIERRAEIISEASRRIPDVVKARHPDIPWPRSRPLATYFDMNTRPLRRR